MPRESWGESETCSRACPQRDLGGWAVVGAAQVGGGGVAEARAWSFPKLVQVQADAGSRWTLDALVGGGVWTVSRGRQKAIADVFLVTRWRIGWRRQSCEEACRVFEERYWQC